MALYLDLQWASSPSHRQAVSDYSLRRWAKAALAPQVENAHITLRVVGKAEGQALNLQFRGKDYATNVLTFDYSGAPELAADIVLCAPVVAAEAKAQGKSLRAHYAHLFIHGLLHAQGYEHENCEAEAEEMELLESLIMRSLALPDPY